MKSLNIPNEINWNKAIKTILNQMTENVLFTTDNSLRLVLFYWSSREHLNITIFTTFCIWLLNIYIHIRTNYTTLFIHSHILMIKKHTFSLLCFSIFEVGFSYSSQDAQRHYFLKCNFLWIWRRLIVSNVFAQIPHLNAFSPEWFVLMWIFIA